jgi:hypothetical protein
VSFFSRPVAPHHRSLAAYERELIGLVLAVCHWRPYLWGHRFLVRTDHFSLKFLLDQRLATIPQHQWVGKLLDFDFSVEYKASRTNTMIDALSQRDTDEPVIHAISGPGFDFVNRLRQAHATDPALVALKEELAAGQRLGSWSLLDGLVAFNGHLYILPASPLLHELISTMHDDGHEGVQCTLHRLRQPRLPLPHPPARGPGLCPRLRHMPTLQVGPSTPGRPTPAFARAHSGLDGHWA